MAGGSSSTRSRMGSPPSRQHRHGRCRRRLNAGPTRTIELISGITDTAVTPRDRDPAGQVAGNNVVVSTNYGNVFVTGDRATGSRCRTPLPRPNGGRAYGI